MITTILLTILLLASFGGVFYNAFLAGYYTARSESSGAMASHHGRMLKILDEENRIPDFHDVSKSLDLMRNDRMDERPSAREIFFGKGK